MKSTDLADATARALDLLPPGDPALTDPRLLRDARLMEEARLTRETAADVWLAVSPLHVAPPDVLKAVLADIDPARPSKPANNILLLKGLALGGWAAAAALLLALWVDTDVKPLTRKVSLDPIDTPAETLDGAPAQIRNSRDSRMRSEILRLQSRLAEARNHPKNGSPRVISLRAPGAPARSPEDSQRRVQTILTNALRSALEAESGAGSLVIERGWLAGGLPALEDGGVVRHRNFPENSWQELGLLRSEDGSYYDSNNGLVWTPDPEGYGFVGRPVTEADDLTVYHAADDEPPSKPKQEPRTQPEGFIVENPVERKAEVIIDQVPKLEAGKGYIIAYTDSSGKTRTMNVTEGPGGFLSKPMMGPSGTRSNPNLTGASSGPLIGNTGTLMFTVPSSTSLTSFRLLEGSLVPNGQAPRVIVQSQP